MSSNMRSEEQSHQPRSESTPRDATQPDAEPDNPLDSNHLSPFYTPQLQHSSTSVSPSANSFNTPADSFSTGAQYQPSDLSEIDDDPFWGADFSIPDAGTPAFLDTQLLHITQFSDQKTDSTILPGSGQSYNALGRGVQEPLSPDLTPSLRGASPEATRQQFAPAVSSSVIQSVSPKDLSKRSSSLAGLPTHSGYAAQLTPDTSGSNPSSEDGTAPANMALPPQSTHVTVSWSKDDVPPLPPPSSSTQPFEPQPDAENPSPTTVCGGLGPDDTHNRHVPTYSLDTLEARDEHGQWMPDLATGSRGIDPHARTSTAVESVNELEARRKQEDRNKEVGDWLLRADTLPQNPDSPAMPPRLNTTVLNGEDDGIPREEVAMGNETENKPLPGQTYYADGSGSLTQQDYDMIHQNRNWADAPILFPISREDAARHQPETAQQAIARFERMCRDTDSVVSRAATWGTRRRSLPSISDTDIEGVTSGNFLKKLSLSKGDTRRPSILKELRGLVRNPSANQLLKRGRSNQEDEEEQGGVAKGDRRASQNGQTPPARSQSGKKAAPPSVNSMLASMGSNAASIGTTHARSGSISATLTSPKSAFSGLGVKNTLRRPRSKSELPKDQHAGSTSHPTLVDMWKKTGGPPVPSLAKPTALPEAEEDDDEEDDLYEDAEMKLEAERANDDIVPNFAGFKEHVLKLSPHLATANTHLVDRIAHQQTVRYKQLLNAKLRHLQQIATGQCTCGDLCIGLGGSAVMLDTKKDAGNGDLLSAHLDGSDGDMTPMEGTITQDSFPADIPMPPTGILPAQFECQLCYQSKKFQKPSDWTKHVHEDVQPFTCTWERCREPKIFKRKADWVRHENEGHRHLEWWTCDVDECRHVCYRRDNFLQHLVREHKFTEPKVKTKSLIKRNPQMEPTWQKVDSCHEETQVRPQDEPCRFCGKSFPTWKKLTVHLAKHMEQISLPVLRLVARKQLDPDTIISPVQDPPPRALAPFSQVKAEPMSFHSTPNLSQAPQFDPQGNNINNPFAYPDTQPGGYMFPLDNAFHGPYYDVQPYDVIPPANVAPSPHMSMPQVTNGYLPGPATGYTVGPNHYVSGPPGIEPFPVAPMNPLGLYEQPITFNGGGVVLNPPSVSVSGSEHLTPQGSVSPYNRSPHQGAGAFYTQ